MTDFIIRLYGLGGYVNIPVQASQNRQGAILVNHLASVLLETSNTIDKAEGTQNTLTHFELISVPPDVVQPLFRSARGPKVSR